MRKTFLTAMFATALLVLAAPARAQQGVQNPPDLPGTPVTITGFPGITTLNATAAINNAVTLTLTPPAGSFVYLCGLDLIVSNSATGAVVATNLSFTSTNIGGWAYKYSMVGTANTNGVDRSFTWWPCIKSSTAGTAVTIVSPAANAQAAYSINGYYYFGK